MNWSASYMFTAGTPDPDLIIRTSGEMRVSNFLIWQAAYAEWYVSPTYWPDFDREELRRVLVDYGQRDRRFGRLSTAGCAQESPKPMLAERLLVVIFLIPIGVGVIALGGIPYTIVVALILGLAAWEYVKLFRKGGMAPSAVLVIGGTVALTVLRAWLGFGGMDVALAALALLAMVYHLVAYERGEEHAATDFGVTLGGILYLGWLGAYLISLRFLPDGFWWIMLALPAVWLADAGAFFVGRRFGRRPLSPRLSPKKTWEGYWGGVVIGLVGGALLAALWGLRSPTMLPLRGAVVGLVLAVVTPLGDLGESMFKRQFGVKNSSGLVPGHGGVLDRINSWLWAAVIGYYLATWVWPS